MGDATQIDDWLDRWEELREQGQGVSVQKFVEAYLQAEPPELIEQFRSKAVALESMADRLKSAQNDSPQVPDASGIQLKPGLVIQGYKLESKLGSGGFGEVWKAHAPGGFKVALKFVRLGNRVGKIEKRALKIIREIRHPNLLTAFGAWQNEQILMIAMELADQTLADRYQEAVHKGHMGIPREELLEYFNEAAKALDYLNEARHQLTDGPPVAIQHRDIKPQNIMLCGGSVKVGDFGLVQLVDASMVGHTGGMTVAYAAPEFFDGKTSNRSDQYSLAVTYCHLRGGRLPFDGSQAQVMAGHMSREPYLSMLPIEERASVAKALAKQPADRWPNCRAFVNALQHTSVGNLADTLPPNFASANHSTLNGLSDQETDTSGQPTPAVPVLRQQPQRPLLPVVIGTVVGTALLVMILVFALSGNKEANVGGSDQNDPTATDGEINKKQPENDTPPIKPNGPVVPPDPPKPPQENPITVPVPVDPLPPLKKPEEPATTPPQKLPRITPPPPQKENPGNSTNKPPQKPSVPIPPVRDPVLGKWVSKRGTVLSYHEFQPGGKYVFRRDTTRTALGTWRREGELVHFQTTSSDPQMQIDKWMRITRVGVDTISVLMDGERAYVWERVK